MRGVGPIRRAWSRAVIASVATIAAAGAAAGAGNGNAHRPAAVRTTHVEAAVALERVTSAATPVYVTSPPDDPTALAIVERAGVVSVVSHGARRRILDLRRLVSTNGEEGLLSIAFDPAYRRNHVLYADYTDRRGDINVVAYRARAGRVAQRLRVLLRVRHRDSPYHNGGQLAIGPDGGLYVGLGDGGYLPGHDRIRCRAAADCARRERPFTDPHGNAENLGVRLGKIVRISTGSGHASVVAYGLRNPWRFSFDSDSGDLYIGDVGWNKWEEVDVVPHGTHGLLNFGWSKYEGRAPGPHPSRRLNPAGRLTWPVITYPHTPVRARRACSGSIVGGYVYRGSSVPSLRGRYVYGDFCSGRIWSARISDGNATDQRLEKVHVGTIDSFGVDGRGELYAVSIDGRIYRFVER